MAMMRRQWTSPISDAPSNFRLHDYATGGPPSHGEGANIGIIWPEPLESSPLHLHRPQYPEFRGVKTLHRRKAGFDRSSHTLRLCVGSARARRRCAAHRRAASWEQRLANRPDLRPFAVTRHGRSAGDPANRVRKRQSPHKHPRFSCYDKGKPRPVQEGLAWRAVTICAFSLFADRRRRPAPT